MKSWIEVSEQRLAGNYRAAAAVLGGAPRPAISLVAVIKANGYGHGAALCAPVLARAGGEWLGVTDAGEGAAVRAALTAAGIPPEAQPRILVLCGHLPEDTAAIFEHRLTPVVWTSEQIAVLAATGTPLPLHIEIDTGMSRQGVTPEALPGLLRQLSALPHLRLDGVLTHFSSAEVAGSSQTAAQRSRFEAAMQLLQDAGCRLAWVHAGNTSAIDNAADIHNGEDTPQWLRRVAEDAGARPMMREGLGLYGYALRLSGLVASDGEDTPRLAPVLRPVMTWKTRILSISEVSTGTRIGYNGTFVATDPMRLALLPVGYADGLRRELSCTTGSKGAGWVILGKHRAPIVGRISMNLTTVDITGIPDAAVGSEAVLLGEGITAEDHAALAGTIPYEILCGIRAPAILR